MRLTVTTNVSVDGVMQGLGGPDEDRRGGFNRGGWAPPLVDAETGDHIDQVYGGASAFLDVLLVVIIVLMIWKPGA